MLNALTISLSGMRSTQTMLDVTANNLANSDTPGFKAGRTMFADQLHSLSRDAVAPTGPVGGRNPDQIGNGTQVAAVQTVFTQGGAELTGRNLDLMINGDAFFQLADQDGGLSYSRVGAFGFDGGFQGTSRLVDLVSGGLVLNTQGEAISPVERLAATPTTDLVMNGNLPPEDIKPLHGNALSSLFGLRAENGSPAIGSTPLASTNLSRGVDAAVNLQVFGTAPDGQPFSGTVNLGAGATVSDLMQGLNQVLIRTTPVVDGTGAPVLDAGGLPLTRDIAFAQASISQGSITITSAMDGQDLSVFLGEQPVPGAPISDQAANTWQHGVATDVFSWNRMRLVPSSVETELPVYTADGTAHTMSGRWFSTGTVTTGTGLATDYQRTWDLVVDDPVGAGNLLNPGSGTLRGLTFDASGALLSSPVGTIDSTWTVGGASTVTLDTSGFTGFQDTGVADATDYTGSPAGLLQGVSITSDGFVQGIYSNGKTVTMSATDHQIGLASFANPSGLLALDQNRFQPSGNSGAAFLVDPGTAGTNTITAGALEGSNVDLSSEFTRLIISQRGFQSNSKAFQTADQILREANGLIR